MKIMFVMLILIFGFSGPAIGSSVPSDLQKSLSSKIILASDEPLIPEDYVPSGTDPKDYW